MSNDHDAQFKLNFQFISRGMNIQRPQAPTTRGSSANLYLSQQPQKLSEVGGYSAIVSLSLIRVPLKKFGKQILPPFFFWYKREPKARQKIKQLIEHV